MSDIPPIKETGGPASLSPGRPAPATVRSRETVLADEVEISETGQLLSTLDSQTGIRADKVARIREAIENGTYETPEKIEVTVDRLLEVLQAMRETT